MYLIESTGSKFIVVLSNIWTRSASHTLGDATICAFMNAVSIPSSLAASSSRSYPKLDGSDSDSESELSRDETPPDLVGVSVGLKTSGDEAFPPGGRKRATISASITKVFGEAAPELSLIHI